MEVDTLYIKEDWVSVDWKRKIENLSETWRRRMEWELEENKVTQTGYNLKQGLETTKREL